MFHVKIASKYTPYAKARFLVLFGILICAALASSAIAGKGGKGKPGGGGGGGDDGGGGGTTASVVYDLQYLDVPAAWGSGWETSAKDINHLGTVVGNAVDTSSGQSLAAAWYPDGSMLDLNAVGSWFEPDGEEVFGWTAVVARSVNQSEQMVGVAERTGDLQRAFLFDWLTNTFTLMPAVEGQLGIGDKGIDINDDGVVAARIVYDNESGGAVYAPPTYAAQGLPNWSGGFGGDWIRINNLGTITSQSGAVYFPGTVPYDYSNAVLLDLTGSHRFWGLRDDADVATGRQLGSGKGKNKVPSGPVALNLNTGVTTWFGSSGYNGRDINLQNDLIVGNFAPGRSAVYKEGEGLFPIDDLVTNPDPSWQQAQSIVAIALSNPNDFTDPQVTGWGAIVGTRWETNLSGQRAFLLRPRSPN